MTPFIIALGIWGHIVCGLTIVLPGRTTETDSVMATIALFFVILFWVDLVAGWWG